LYTGQIIGLNVIEEKSLSVICILVLTTVSCLGIRGGKLVQNLIATAKVDGLAGIICLSLVKGSRPIWFTHAAAGTGDGFFSFTKFGIALVAVLWAYEAWHIVSFAAGEMKNPQRDLPLRSRRSSFTALIRIIGASFL
jgi:amino acid transporter